MRRGAVLSVCAFAALTLGAGSCSTAATSSLTATGTTLTVYAGAPGSGPQAADVLSAEQLAYQQFQQGGAQVGKYKIKFVVTKAAKVSDNARTAIEDQGSIAYIGELPPGTSADSLGITNGEDLLQVSPTDTALELTQSTPAVPGAPDDYYESLKTYGRTFARVVPNSQQEAKAQVAEMTSLGVKKLYVTNDGSPYGAAIAHAVAQAVGAGVTATEGSATAAAVQSAGADAVFYGAGSTSASTVAHLFQSVAAANPKVKLFAPSALAQSAFASALGSGSPSVYVSEPGYLPKRLPAAGKQFVSAFKSAYGHPPAAQAVFGYEAVSAVLAVLREAGSAANDRATVVRDFFSIKNRNGAIGTYSINSSTGDVSIAPFVFSRLRGGVLVPFAQVQG